MRAFSKTRQHLIKEMRFFLLIAFFLAFLLCSFVAYRRILLELPPFGEMAYFYAVIEAFILAKIILLGRMLGLGERFRNQRLALVVLYKALVFALFVLLFSSAEEVIRDLLTKHPMSEIYAGLLAKAQTKFL